MKRQLTLLYFQTVLAASGSLDAIWAATITRNHLRMAEMDSATEKNGMDISHVFMYGFSNGLHRFKNNIDARNKFSDPKNL